MGDTWLGEDDRAMAPDRLLDAAGRCFAEQGVSATTIGDIARAAGCSRPTVYRYFEDREALRVAFVHREARRVGAHVRDRIRALDDPGERLVEAVIAALAAVRSNPTLAAWFSGGDAGLASSVAASSSVIASLVGPSVDEHDQAAPGQAARWIVRVVLSLLAMPGRDAAEERALLERFVVPVVAPAAR